MFKLTATLLIGAALCSAGSLVYDVNRTAGSMTVSGTITTDGATGQLGTSDILDWNLLLNDGTITFNLLPGSNRRVLVVGADLTASLTALSFNYSAADSGFFLIQDFNNENDQWCAGTSSVCSAVPAGDVLLMSQDSDFQFQNLSGTQVIATADFATPEPSTLALFGGGIAILGYRKRQTFRR